MTIGVLSAIAVLAAAFLVLGWPRVDLPRRPSIEGIEDPEAVQAYDRISRWPQFRLLRRMVTAKLGSYQPKGGLADIGCGPGYLTFLIAQSLPQLHIIGVDLSDQMIQTASSNASSLGLSERVQFRKGDIGSLPFSDDALDFVVSTLSLHHWSDPHSALCELHRVLRPGGQFLLFDLRRDGRRFFYWLLGFATSFFVPVALRRINEPVGSALSSYTPHELEGIISRTPFTQWRTQPGSAWLFVWGSKT